jgi:small-conductance mechanosensitive channel
MEYLEKAFAILSTESNLLRLVISILSLLLAWFLRNMARRRLNRLSASNSYENHRVVIVRKIIAAAFWLLVIILLLTIWGVDLDNIALYLGSFITLVAIGFFAVWSMLSNIIAGFFIYLFNPFKIGSKLRLYDPEAVATVKNINLMFTELEDEEGIFSLPNNLFFQRVIKVIGNTTEGDKINENQD